MPKTMKNRNASNRKTKKNTPKKPHNGLNNQVKSHVVNVFLGMLNTVKIYHWKTCSYSQHKATDDLYSNLNGHIDTFIEILLGKDESRIHLLDKKIELLEAHSKADFKERVYQYREFLIDMNKTLDSERDTDLLNVRDEILGDINQFLYLLTFNK
jgi:DNA-binding ferritin-like protein